MLTHATVGFKKVKMFKKQTSVAAFRNADCFLANAYAYLFFKGACHLFYMHGLVYSQNTSQPVNSCIFYVAYQV